MINQESDHFLGRVAGTAALCGVLVVGVAACGEAPDPQGIVHIGADGKEYVLPEDARRAVYGSRQDCIDDVRDQMGKIKDELGEEVQEKPEDLCEATDDYTNNAASASHTTVVSPYPHGYFYGPVISEGGRWDSGRVKTWENNIPDGTFAAPNRVVQKGVVEAPKGSVAGSKVTVRGGFGVTGKGFASGAAS